MMQKSVLVLGSTCVDVIIRLERLPKTEENLRPLGQRFAMGGCAYNVANVLGRAGADVTFVTPVGLRGVYGPYVLPILNKQPWVKPVLLPEAENGCCYCLVEASGERTFLSVHGTEYSFMSDWMAPYRNRRFDYGYVCGLELEEPTGGTLVTWLEKETVDTVLYAPGPRGLRVPAERTERLLCRSQPGRPYRQQRGGDAWRGWRTGVGYPGTAFPHSRLPRSSCGRHHRRGGRSRRRAAAGIEQGDDIARCLRSGEPGCRPGSDADRGHSV